MVGRISDWGKRAFYGLSAACWLGCASAQISLGPETWRPATLEDLTKPRTSAAGYVVRASFPAERRAASAATREAVAAWAQANGLSAQLARFVSHDYELAPGLWVPFLEWQDYRAEIKAGEPVRLYLLNLDQLMFVLFVHKGWSPDLSPLEQQLLAVFVRRNMFPEAGLEQLAGRMGVSPAALSRTLGSMERRKLIYRGPSDDKLKPGNWIMVRIGGSYAHQKTANPDLAGPSGYLRFEQAAQERMNALVKCLGARAEGFPRDLAALAQGCADPDLAPGMAYGYRYTYCPGPADGQGRITVYSLCAEPVLVTVTGLSTFGFDERSGRVRSTYTSEPFVRPGPCPLAMRDGNEYSFREIKHCLVAFAANNPLLGYPAELTALGPAGDGCLTAVATGRDSIDRFDVTPRADKRYSYRPGKPGADGRISTFELRRGDVFYGQQVEDLLTERGEVHSAEWRAARRDDPAPAVLRGRIAERMRSREARWKTAGERCAQGSVPDCGEYAHYQWASGEREKSYPLWDEACAAGHAESCVFSRKFMAGIDARWQKACKEREPLGCETWSQHKQVFSDAITLKRACERGVKDACARLTEMAAQLHSGGRLLPLPKPNPNYRPFMDIRVRP
jgi:hypothetical protein